VIHISPAGNRCHFVQLDNDESCPTADLSNTRLSQWSGLFDRSDVEHAPDVEFMAAAKLQKLAKFKEGRSSWVINGPHERPFVNDNGQL